MVANMFHGFGKEERGDFLNNSILECGIFTLALVAIHKLALFLYWLTVY